MSTKRTVAWARPLLAALIAATAAFAAHAQNQVANGGFETGDFAGWLAAIGPFSGVDAVAAHSGSFGAFTGEFGTLGTLSQNLTTVPGTTYAVSFWLRSDGAMPSQLSLSWDGAVLYAATNIAASGYAQLNFTAVAGDASTALQFAFRSDNGFLELDDIAVTAVPEPASFLMLGGGLIGLAALRRRHATA